MSRTCKDVQFERFHQLICKFEDVGSLGEDSVLITLTWAEYPKISNVCSEFSGLEGVHTGDLESTARAGGEKVGFSSAQNMSWLLVSKMKFSTIKWQLGLLRRV